MKSSFIPPRGRFENGSNNLARKRKLHPPFWYIISGQFWLIRVFWGWEFSRSARLKKLYDFFSCFNVDSIFWTMNFRGKFDLPLEKRGMKKERKKRDGTWRKVKSKERGREGKRREGKEPGGNKKIKIRRKEKTKREEEKEDKSWKVHSVANKSWGWAPGLPRLLRVTFLWKIGPVQVL